MGQSIHTGGSGQSFWHGGHHFRVNNCDDRHVVWVNTYEFTFSFHIGNNIVDGYFRSSSGCGRYGDDRYARLFGRSHALKASHIFKFRVCDDDADGFGSIHGGTTADSNQIISTGILEGLYAVLYIFDGWIRFDVAVKFIVQTVFF